MADEKKYIDETAVISELAEALVTGELSSLAYGRLGHRIFNIPAADVRPVVRGRWEPISDGGYWRCTSCAEPTEAFGAKRLYRFCPFCGADMREAET